MKKILKKIGVFGIIVAILAPFTTLPKVNAAESCERHLQSYLFLDVTAGNKWKQYAGDGYRTFSSFLYTFPNVSSSQTLKVESAEIYELDDDDKIEEYFNAYQLLIESDNSVKDIEKFGTYDTQKFTSGDYLTQTGLLHGYWSIDSESEECDKSNETVSTACSKAVKSNYNLDKYENAEDEDSFYAHTIQGVLLDGSNYDNIDLNTSIGGATISGNVEDIGNGRSKYVGASGYFGDSLKFFDKITKEIDDSINEKYLWYDAKDNLRLNLNIERTISKEDLNKLKFGYKVTEETDEKGVVKIFTTDTETEVKKIGDKEYTSAKSVKNSYDALQHTNLTDGTCINATENPCRYYYTNSTEDININTRESYYWPVILNIEYSVCTNTEEAVKWTLKYDENVSDNSVTNMPSPKTETYDAGVSATVSNTKPERKNYTFDKWCTEPNGSGDCYTAGNEIKNSGVSTTVTLYAQWKEVGTTENKKTGVISYVIGFAAVGLVAGGIYLVSKKKNLFKQI